MLTNRFGKIAGHYWVTVIDESFRNKAFREGFPKKVDSRKIFEVPSQVRASRMNDILMMQQKNLMV